MSDEHDPRFEGSGVPPHIRPGIIRYVDHGIPTGGFLAAVISNDLQGAFGRADDLNRPALFDIVKWFYCHAPSACWGSPERMYDWIARHERARSGEGEAA